MPKRKAIQIPSTPTAKRTKLIPNIKINKTSKSIFRLFDLPAELRNMIYQYIAESNTAQLKGRNVTDNSGLIAVGDRLCDEYFPILLLHAGKIEATVTNFNFQNIVTFINRLSTAELTTISTTTKPTDRAMEIVLRVTECPSPNVDLMERWYAKQLVKGSPSDLRQLNRRGHATKKGTMLNISYSLEYDASAMIPRHWVYGRSAKSIVELWAGELKSYESKAVAGSAPKAEAAKIRVLFEEIE